jgi:tetratricopeptide (TPR) repeat protein
MRASFSAPIAPRTAIAHLHNPWQFRLVGIFGVLILLQKAMPLWAQPPLSHPTAPPAGLSAEQILGFAEQLMGEGEYFRAITEYRRFLFSYPDDARAAMVLFRIGLALYRGRSYGEALQTFREVAQRYSTTVYGRQARLWQGESLLRQAQYEMAEQVYTEIIEHDPEASGQFARYQRGWTFLYRRRWQEAAAEFQHVSPENPLYAAAQRLSTEARDGAQLPRKSPALAGILSGLLPGSGQLYNGRRGDALLAFLLNGLFIVGTVEAIEGGELAIAGVLSFFEVGWYTGNVYGAVNGAHKHNRQMTETFLQNLENRFRLPPPEAHLTPHRGGRLGLSSASPRVDRPVP